jgi:carbonic anhydrase
LDNFFNCSSKTAETATSILDTLVSTFSTILSSPKHEKQEIKEQMAAVAEWGYDDEDTCGPCNWPGVPKNGTQQSPIDLKLSKMKTYTLADPIKFVNYNKPLNGEFVNTGYSVQFVPDSRMDVPEIYGGMLDQSYRFIQYHYHWAQNDNEGSEHTLGGLSYPAELHLVHQGVDDPSKLAVLGVFLTIGKDDSALSAEEAIFGKICESGSKAEYRGQVLEKKLPENLCSFARYQGSLTTPPCSECVTWTVFTDPISVTREQLAALRQIKDCRGKVHRKNYRPVQRLNGRQVLLTC